MSKRLSDRARGAALTIESNGTPIRGFASESLAAAPFSADHSVVSRSLNYHRHRGAFCMDGHCGGGLMRVNGVPNIRTCMQRCSEGACLETQNAYPSAERDLLGAVDFVFSKDKNHHTLMTGSKFLTRMTQKIVRHLSGFGERPDTIARPPLASQARQVEALVLGSGGAGLCAAIAAAQGGAQTLLVDEGLRPGGSLRSDPRFSEEEGGLRTTLIHAVEAATCRARELGAQT